MAKKIPTNVALMKLERVPASTAFKPKRAISGRRDGASTPKPPNRIAIEDKFAKPHKATVTITCECALNESLMPTKSM